MGSKEHIYDYLAEIYFSKKDKEERNVFLKFLLGANLIILSVLFVFFLVYPYKAKEKKESFVKVSALNINWIAYPIKFKYDISYPKPQVAVLNLQLPKVDLRGYDILKISIKGSKKEGFSRIIGVQLKNSRRESDMIYLSDIEDKWKEFEIPLEEFKYITDFSEITQISFKLEAWNVSKKKGLIFIDKIEFLKRG